MRKLSSNCVAFVVFMFNFLFAVELVADTLEQVVVGTAAPTALSDGQTIDLTVTYAATDNALVSGLGARLHFDSSALMVGDYSYRLSEGAQPFQIIDDFFDLDSDVSTDKYLLTSWADVSGAGWPINFDQPVVLYIVPLTANSDFSGTTLKFTGASVAPGYSLVTNDLFIAENIGSLDIDGNGQFDALTDGLLLLRSMFGLTQDALISGTVAPDAIYTTAEGIQARITELGNIADIDNNTEIDALTDGLLILRYLFGLQAEVLIDGVVSDNSRRSTAGEIENYLRRLTATNSSPPVFTSGAIFSAAENQTAIGTVTATDTDTDNGLISFTVSGSELSITSAGVLTFSSAPDYETQSSYSATVTASDGTNSTDQSITVTVTDVDDVAPVFSSSASFSAAENQTAIGTVTATDVDTDNSSISFSVSGSELTITSAGVLTFASAPDYETKSSYTATVTATDGTNSTDQSITVNVTNLNDNSPVFTSLATFSAAENQRNIGTVTATDDDASDSITFTVSGSELLITSAGVLSFAATPDYETKTSYTATVTATDGTNTVTQNITISVTDANDSAPVFTSNSSFSAAENQIAIATLTASDPEDDAIVFTISGSELSITSAGVLTFSSAPDYETQSSYSATVTASDGTNSTDQSITVTVTDVDDVAPVFSSSASFSSAENQTAIGTVTATDVDTDNSSISFSVSGSELTITSAGVLTFASAPDYETKSSYTATVTATDGTNSATQNIAVSIININEAPIITSGSSYNADENQTEIGFITATDESTDLIYELTGTDASNININNSTGQMAFNSAPDYETKEVYSAIARVYDDIYFTQKAFQILVTNLNDNSPTFISDSILSVDEGTTSIVTVSASDLDGDSIAFSVSGDDADSLSIDASSGVLAFSSAPDYEVKSSYAAIITASDGENTTDQSITVSINNLNDNSPSFTSSLSFTANENQTAIGTVSATDADGDTVTYSLAGADSDAISINDTSGVLTFNASPNHEEKASYSVTVTASDGQNTDEESINISIVDLNDSGPVFTNSASQNIDEQDSLPYNNSWENFSVTTLTATNDIGVQDNNISFEFSTAGGVKDNNSFDLTGANLHIGQNGLDYESACGGDGVCQVTITATNSFGSTVQNMEIDINNTNDENTGCPSSSIYASINEETSGYVLDLSSQMASCFDPDGYPLSFYLSDANDIDQHLSAVLDASAQTVTIDVPDSENLPGSGPSYQLVMYANDGNSQSAINIHITVVDLNDNAPSWHNGAYEWNKGEYNGPSPKDDGAHWFGPSVCDSDKLHDYTDLTISLSGTDASEFELLNYTETTGWDEDTSNSNGTCRGFVVSPVNYQDYETNTKNTYNFSLDFSDGTNTGQTNVTVNIIDKKGVEDSETLLSKHRMWRYRETTNSSKVFNKNNQLNQSQPWGLGLIFKTEQNGQGRLIQISPKHTEQSGVDYDYAQAIEGSGYISWGLDNGGRYIEFKYHEFSSVSPAASYGYTFKTYIQPVPTNYQWEGHSWGLYVDFDGTSNAQYDESAFRVFLIDLDGTDVVDMTSHPNSTVTFDYTGSDWAVDPPNREGYVVNPLTSTTYTNNSRQYFYSLVSTTFLPNDLPDTNEIYTLVTDPLKWLDDYKIGQEYRRYSGSDTDESGHLLQNFQKMDLNSAKSTQVYLFCEEDDINSSGNIVRDEISNQVYLDAPEYAADGQPLEHGDWAGASWSGTLPRCTSGADWDNGPQDDLTD